MIPSSKPIPIKKLPELDWTDNSSFEIAEAGGDYLVQQSDCAYMVNNVLVAGLVYRSFTSPPWFWFALAKGITFRDLIDFRRLKDYIPLGALTAVAVDFQLAHRFAKFYGFEDTGEPHSFHGRDYTIYRRA